jgi:transcriptional regulator GlxA family with amidase domain
MRSPCATPTASWRTLTGAFAAALALASPGCAQTPSTSAAGAAAPADAAAAGAAAANLTPPATGRIRVAFAISERSNVIDMAGPWEVFQDTHVHTRGDTMDEMMPFELFTVAATRDPVRLTGGLQVVPDHTFADAPQPHVVVVPAMVGSPELHAWLRRVEPRADVVMSVCTGAFQLARAGLLDGRRATTHHDYWDDFAGDFPRVELVRGQRWVEANGRIATAGGLTSGIDLALRVVARYFGEDVARTTAEYMEHGSEGWRDAGATPVRQQPIAGAGIARP